MQRRGCARWSTNTAALAADIVASIEDQPAISCQRRWPVSIEITALMPVLRRASHAALVEADPAPECAARPSPSCRRCSPPAAAKTPSRSRAKSTQPNRASGNRGTCRSSTSTACPACTRVEIRFLHVRFDPDVGIGDEAHRAGRAERRHRRNDQRAGLQRTHRGDDAVERRAYDRVIELPLRLGDRRARFHHVGKTVDRKIRIAVQARQRRVGRLIERVHRGRSATDTSPAAGPIACARSSPV